MTRLLIVSHTPHYLRNGQTVGWGATVREIDHLSTLFQSIVHVAPLHNGPADESALPYESPRVRLAPVVPAGGASWASKLGIVAQLPQYWRAIRGELHSADVVHIRCPSNISMLALAVLATSNRTRRLWFKYAGNWRPGGPESLSYRLQRWWLARRWHRGMVTVNGSWPNQPPHVVTFFNPCLTEAELRSGSASADRKRLTQPARLLFVGRLEAAKGVDRLLNIGSSLDGQGLDFTIDLVGDGPDRELFCRRVNRMGLCHRITFHGWMARAAINPLYERSHLFVLPTTASEGWPKVLSEAMAYGVVPVTSNVSSIPHYFREFSTGSSLPAHDVGAFSRIIAEYCSSPESWHRESQAAVRAARHFSYTEYLTAVRSLLRLDDPSGQRSGADLWGAQDYS